MLLNATHSFIYININMNRDYLRLIFRFFVVVFLSGFFFFSYLCMNIIDSSSI